MYSTLSWAPAVKGSDDSKIEEIFQIPAEECCLFEEIFHLSAAEGSVQFKISPETDPNAGQNALFSKKSWLSGRKRLALDCRIEEIFQTPAEEDNECNEEREGSRERAEDKDDSTRALKENYSQAKDVGGQAKNTSVSGIVVARGRKMCKHCGSPLED